MRGRCDNPKCARKIGLQPQARHWGNHFCCKACKTQYRHDVREEIRRRKAVRQLFQSA